MVEPGGNSFRAVRAAQVEPGERLLVFGAATIGLMAGLFGIAQGAEVHLVGRSPRSLDFARSLGFDGVWTEATVPDLPFHAVIDASNAPHLPERALRAVEPGRRVVYVGLAGTPSLIDTRALALADVTAVGVLSASPGIGATIDSFAAGEVDPTPLIAATVSLGSVPEILSGRRPTVSGAGPKFQVELASA